MIKPYNQLLSAEVYSFLKKLPYWTEVESNYLYAITFRAQSDEYVTAESVFLPDVPQVENFLILNNIKSCLVKRTTVIDEYHTFVQENIAFTETAAIIVLRKFMIDLYTYFDKYSCSIKKLNW